MRECGNVRICGIERCRKLERVDIIVCKQQRFLSFKHLSNIKFHQADSVDQHQTLIQELSINLPVVTNCQNFISCHQIRLYDFINIQNLALKGYVNEFDRH